VEYDQKSVGAVLLMLALTFLIVGFDAVPGSASSPKAGKSQSVKLSTTTKVSPKDMKYDLVKATYSKNNITIHYPQISNLSDSAKQKKLNDILKNSALKRLNITKNGLP